MKTCLKLVGLIAFIAAPSILMAQTPSSGFNPVTSFAKPFKEITRPDLRLIPDPSAENRQQPSFMNRPPSTLPGETTKIIIGDTQTDPAYYYNMPIVKPGKTSKILTAKLDPDSPYSYNMPVKKNRVIEK